MRTEALLDVAATLAALPRAVALGTVRVRVVLVADLVEELDLVLALEERDRDTVDGRITPPLKRCFGLGKRRVDYHYHARGRGRMTAYLVVEATLGVEELEVLRVGLAPPEIHVRDLEVAPDCEGEKDQTPEIY